MDKLATKVSQFCASLCGHSVDQAGLAETFLEVKSLGTLVRDYLIVEPVSEELC